jgi:hypothetical protein
MESRNRFSNSMYLDIVEPKILDVEALPKPRVVLYGEGGSINKQRTSQ